MFARCMAAEDLIGVHSLLYHQDVSRPAYEETSPYEDIELFAGKVSIVHW